MISVCFKGKDSISQLKNKQKKQTTKKKTPIYASTSHAEEAEVEQLYEGLKLNIQKNEIMTSGPITSWQIDGETVDTVTDFILRGSKITADGDCCHEIKRHLLLERKAMANLDSILKSRNITLPTKVHPVKARFFQ